MDNLLPEGKSEAEIFLQINIKQGENGPDHLNQSALMRYNEKYPAPS